MVDFVSWLFEFSGIHAETKEHENQTIIFTWECGIADPGSLTPFSLAGDSTSKHLVLTWRYCTMILSHARSFQRRNHSFPYWPRVSPSSCVHFTFPHTHTHTQKSCWFAKKESPTMCNPQLYLSLKNTLGELQKYFNGKLLSQRKGTQNVYCTLKVTS